MADDKHSSEAFHDARLMEAAQLLQSQHPEFESLEVAVQTIKRALEITNRWNGQIDHVLSQVIRAGEPMTIDLAAEIISYGLMHAVAQGLHKNNQRRGLHDFGVSLFGIGHPKLVYPVPKDAPQSLPRGSSRPGGRPKKSA